MVSTTQVFVSYTSNGVTTTFAVPFYFFANGDLIVTYIDQYGNKTIKVLGTDYSVTGAGFNSTGGSVVFGTAPATGTITILRSTAATQSSTFINNDSFNGQTMEAALDRVTLIAQETAYAAIKSNTVTLTYNSSTFQVTVTTNFTATSLPYQTQYSSDGINWINETTGTNIVGASPITLSSAAQAATYYRAIVGNGINGAVFSNVINQ